MIISNEIVKAYAEEIKNIAENQEMFWTINDDEMDEAFNLVRSLRKEADKREMFMADELSDLEDSIEYFLYRAEDKQRLQAIMGIKMMCDAVISRIEDETSLTDEQREAITKSVEKHMTI